MNTMTLQDVADLANVQRPVVSMWRKRQSVAGVSIPFPRPVEKINGVERFAPIDVIDYLRRTRRGNNLELEYDAPAIAVPDGVAIDDIETMLAWHVLTGAALCGTTVADRVRLAREFDPDDALLLSEVSTLQPTDRTLAYVDDLVEASYGPSDALARLHRSRLKREMAARDLTPNAIRLLTRVTTECAVFLAADGLTLHADGSAVALDVAAQAGLAVSSQDRAVLRRAAIAGIGIGSARDRSLTFHSVIGLGASQALDQADDLVLGLDPGQVAVLVGPASALADTLVGDLQVRRANALRVGNVVAALRLPRGFWREAHRQNQAVWVCRGGADELRPCVADLAGVSEVDLGDLAADVAAALAQTDDRAFRYARRVERSGVLTGGPLVPRGARATVLRSADQASHLDRVHAATLTTMAPLAPLDILVEASPGRVRLRHRSFGELCDEKKLAVKRGNRIDITHAAADGSVVVLPTELCGEIRMDPLDAEQRYPRSVRTEPGDVIFVEKPIPRAWVDARGGAMVISPARILRLGPAAEIGPRLLAAVINHAVTPGSEWQTWSTPAISRDEADRLEAALADVERYEAEATRRLDAATALKKALIDGVAAGALTLNAQPTTPGVAAAELKRGH
ncbi:hypothetical protein [Mycobacterium sp. DL592]|uniref:hypothetical protein n=1 Tax=Mycobacterium sp. DL592 TaxID=2675524 RepID=UPI001420B390|nr:hypothetical protein [Mycobacterium sp. DL592]